MFRARPNLVRPSEVSAKVQNRRPIAITTRETLSRGRPRHATPPRTTKAREPGNASRPRNLRVPRPMHPSEPGNTSRVRPRFHRPNLTVRPRGRPRIRPTPTVPTRPRPDVRPIVPHDRPNAAVDPKPFLKPKLMFSSPA
ncbi:unnamed protein product [Microthlaspi erraticum]|uniref:Uncharacterized protein n=1 Tax=Microthlaspi erraticum TaxID=1685480 RepID=A0A6D2KDY3_9BRAS|nr:unnamed protein product [Microthlaspi erraticum]